MADSFSIDFRKVVSNLLQMKPNPHKADSELDRDQSDSEKEANKERKKRRKATRE